MVDEGLGLRVWVWGLDPGLITKLLLKTVFIHILNTQ